MTEIYKFSPFEVKDGIPAFSRPDRYTENYEQISADHLKVFETEGRNPFINETHWLDCEESTARLVAKYSRDGNMILDVGVGMGRLLSRFPRLKRYGVDISTGYLKHAREVGIEVCYSRIEELPYRQDLFDVITCTDVLEHVFDLNLTFSRIIDVLKPGGKLIVRVPYREDLACYLEPSFPYEFVHLRNFDEHNLRLFIERIFRQKVLEQTLSGYRAGSLRVFAWVPELEVASKLLLDRLEKWLPGMKDFFGGVRCRLYTPTEINVVVEKA